MEQIGRQGEVITLVHFVQQIGDQWRIACMPHMTEFYQTLYHPNYQRSDDIRAVSCPVCKKKWTQDNNIRTLGSTEAALRDNIQLEKE